MKKRKPAKKVKTKETTKTVEVNRKKSWKEKLDGKTVFEVKETDKKFADIPAHSKMLIATPKIVDSYVRKIPSGSQSSVQTMRNDLAIEYGAEYTCPVTSGIFLRIVAEAAYEEYQSGKPLKSITPFWRMADEKSPLAKKVSFGPEFIRKMRKKEGLEPQK